MPGPPKAGRDLPKPLSIQITMELSEDIEMLRESVQLYAAESIAPRAGDIDQANEFPQELWAELGDMGMLDITVPEEFGGSEPGFLAPPVAMAESSRCSVSLCLV